MTRIPLACLVLLSLVYGAGQASQPARAASQSPGTTTVDGRPLDWSALAAEARRLRREELYDPDLAREVATVVVAEREWVRGELQALGVAVPAGTVAAAELRERRSHGRKFASARRSAGFTQAQWAAAVRANVERRILFDRLYASAPDDAAYERVFLDWADRWRARTTCAPPYVSDDACGNRPRPKARCDSFGFVDVCFTPAGRQTRAFWSIFDDVVWIAGTYNNSEAEARLAPRLRRELPAVAGSVELDSDADSLGVLARQRRPLVAVARWLHRLSLRRPTRPVLLPPE